MRSSEANPRRALLATAGTGAKGALWEARGLFSLPLKSLTFQSDWKSQPQKDSLRFTVFQDFKSKRYDMRVMLASMDLDSELGSSAMVSAWCRRCRQRWRSCGSSWSSPAGRYWEHGRLETTLLRTCKRNCFHFGSKFRLLDSLRLRKHRVPKWI